MSALTALFVTGTLLMTASPDPSSLPVVGRHEKIRYGFAQWNHFRDGGVSDEQLIASLGNVGLNVLVANPGDEGRRWSAIAHEHGIRFYAGLYISSLYDNRKDEWRLAVDREGLTCPDRGGRQFRIPCPLDRRAWDVLFAPALEGAKEGWLDGAQLDMEPYGAYTFDLPGEHLCYCDDCFSRYRKFANLEEDPPRPERHAWLRDHDHLHRYLERLQVRLIDLLREIAADIRRHHPTFGFAAYPDWIPDHLTGHWRMQALALGLHHEDAPFIVINSTPYWEDHTRPWWESPVDAYRSMGLRSIMGSWDGGLHGHHPQLQVGAAEAMVEMAMASDGFWRWGERQYSPEEWQTVAEAHRRIRQIESRVGEFVIRGEPIRHFATLREHSGNPLLERALVTRAWRADGKTLVRVFNGNSDWPVTLTVRFPRVEDGQWQLRDPLHDTMYLPAGKARAWSRQALFEGVTIALGGRDDLYLLIEPAEDAADRFRSIRSLAARPHLPRPPALPPVPARLERVMLDESDHDLDAWDLARVDPGNDGHAVRRNEAGQLVIDSGNETGDGRGFLLSRASFPSSAELARHADPNQVFFRVEYDIVSSADPNSGGLVVGAHFNGDDAGGTRILDSLATTDDRDRAITWATFPGDRRFSSSMSPQPVLTFKSRMPHQPGRSMRVDWIAGQSGRCARIEILVDGVVAGELTDPSGDRLGFEAGQVGFWLLLDRDVVIDNFSVWQLAADDANSDVPAISSDTNLTEGDARPSEFVFTSTLFGDEVGFRGQNLGQQVTSALAVADAETGETRPLFRLQGYCREPVLARDRKVVAASVWVNGKGRIYLVNTRTGRAWNISNNDHCDRAPDFSPDRDQVTFLSDRDGTWQVYVMRSDGSDVRRLSTADANHRSPAFSPRGDRVAFVCDVEGNFNVYTVGLDGDDPLPIAPQRGANAYDPTWSPDGSKLCWSIQSRQLRRIAIADVDGANHREMPATQEGPLRFEHGSPTDVTSLCFSPDGTMIAGAFTDYRTSGVFVLDIAASRIRKIVDARPVMPYPFDWYASGTGSPRWIVRTFTGVSFAPDGRSLVYCTNHHRGAEKTDQDWLLTRRGFALYAQPIPGTSDDVEDDDERINLYVPGDRTSSGGAKDAVMLPGTATSWPAQTNW